MEKVQETIEIERIVNLVRGFGWELKQTVVEGETIRLQIEKNVTSPASPSS